MAFLSCRTRWALLCSRSLASHPFFFVDKTPDGSHQMRHGDVNTPFPENLRDPISVDPEASPVTSQQSSLSSFPSHASAPLQLFKNQLR
jgi:hypothetical protein